MKKDRYHDLVKAALVADGWTITHDPFTIVLGRRRGFIDLGAERDFIGAEKDVEKIAVEIKSFLGLSDLDEFEDALGQFLIYLVALEEIEPNRLLFLAIPVGFYNRFFDDPFFVKIADRFAIRLIVYNEMNQKIVLWKR